MSGTEPPGSDRSNGAVIRPAAGSQHVGQSGGREPGAAAQVELQQAAILRQAARRQKADRTVRSSSTAPTLTTQTTRLPDDAVRELQGLQAQVLQLPAAADDALQSRGGHDGAGQIQFHEPERPGTRTQNY